MDKNYLALAIECTAYLELRRFKVERQKLEAFPPPEKKDESEWMKVEEKKIHEEMASIARSVELMAFKEVETMYSSGIMDEHAEIVFSKNISNELIPFLKLTYLPYRKVAKEQIRHEREMAIFNSRFAPLDGDIRYWQAKIPKPFDKSLINVDPRFPIDRVGFLQERAYDRWLTDALKSKPIFFDSPDYVEKLAVFYQTVYLPMDEAEKKAKEPKIEPPPESPPVSVHEKTSKPVLPTEDEGGDEISFTRRHPRLGGQA